MNESGKCFIADVALVAKKVKQLLTNVADYMRATKSLAVILIVS